MFYNVLLNCLAKTFKPKHKEWGVHAHTDEIPWLETQFKDVTISGIIYALMDQTIDTTQGFKQATKWQILYKIIYLGA